MTNNKLTDERIAALATGKGPVSELWEEKAMAAKLQEYRKAENEVVAWVDDAGAELLRIGHPAEVAAKKDEDFSTPLYTAPHSKALTATNLPGNAANLAAFLRFKGYPGYAGFVEEMAAKLAKRT